MSGVVTDCDSIVNEKLITVGLVPRRAYNLETLMERAWYDPLCLCTLSRTSKNNNNCRPLIREAPTHHSQNGSLEGFVWCSFSLRLVCQNVKTDTTTVSTVSPRALRGSTQRPVASPLENNSPSTAAHAHLKTHFGAPFLS